MRSWIIFALSIGLTLAAGELALVHVIDPQPASPEYVDRVDQNCLRVWTYRPNLDRGYANAVGDKINLKTDSHGFRNDQNAWSDPEVVLLGDSFAVGLNTPVDQTFAGNLRKIGLKVLNLGMDGFSTWAAKSIWSQFDQSFGAKEVVLLFYLGNDFRDNLDQMVKPGKNCQASQGVSMKFKVKRWLSERRLVQMTRSAISRMRSNPGAVNPRSYPMLEVLHFADPESKLVLDAVESTRVAIRSLNTSVKRSGRKLTVVGIPTRAHITENPRNVSRLDSDPSAQAMVEKLDVKTLAFDRADRDLKKILSDQGIKYLSLLESMRKFDEDQVFLKNDFHWNAFGQKLAAQKFMESRRGR